MALPPPFSDTYDLPIPEYSVIAPGFGEDVIDNVHHDSGDDALPAYSPPVAGPSQRVRRRNVKHTYYLKNTAGQRWLTVKVNSRDSYEKSVPAFLGGDSVSGVIILELDKAEKIIAVKIRVKGYVVKPYGVTETFVDVTETVWDVSHGDPRSPFPGQEKYKSKFHGHYEIPYNFKFPAETTASPAQLKVLGYSEQQPLPPSWSEAGNYSALHYELRILVKRSRFSSTPDSDLPIQIIYTPKTVPEEISMLRQLAYRDGIPLLPPAMDPDGWYVAGPVTLRGRLHDAQEAAAKLILAVSKPLKFPRGDIIHCILTIESAEAAVVALLSDRAVPQLGLYRDANTRVILPSGKLTDSNSHDPDTLTSSALWWPQDELQSIDDSMPRRTLNGEIQIPVGTKPTFEFSHFYIKYFLKMPPPEVNGFTVEGKADIFHIDVDVVSASLPGPAPHSYIPLQYRMGSQI